MDCYNQQARLRPRVDRKPGLYDGTSFRFWNCWNGQCIRSDARSNCFRVWTCSRYCLANRLHHMNGIELHLAFLGLLDGSELRGEEGFKISSASNLCTDHRSSRCSDDEVCIPHIHASVV